MTTLKIILVGPVYAGQPKSVVVQVNGAPQGGEVEVTLSQTQGKQPLWGPQILKGTADTTGVALVMFELRFAGPIPLACIKATARDTLGTYYTPDAKTFQVLP